ncbi:MAG: hypothetical protein L3K17_03050 [Thermoplasmata archaeon]|nr:hypothetical protein [Thermoplasmata archaeon]
MTNVAGHAGLPDDDRLRHAEAALRRLGYARVAPTGGPATPHPEFWVQEAGVPRRRFPVFLESAGRPAGEPRSSARRAIVVVPDDSAADAAWSREGPGSIDSELSVLVVPDPPQGDDGAHWHARVLGRQELLRLATGVVVGLFRRAEGGENPVDFGEMLGLLRRRFSVDVPRSLGVGDDEDALFVLYHLAQRYTWAPGDGGANLHALTLKPSGPAARLPWFAA